MNVSKRVSAVIIQPNVNNTIESSEAVQTSKSNAKVVLMLFTIWILIKYISGLFLCFWVYKPTYISSLTQHVLWDASPTKLDWLIMQCTRDAKAKEHCKNSTPGHENIFVKVLSEIIALIYCHYVVQNLISLCYMFLLCLVSKGIWILTL
jgi:hypothetical protein